MRCIKDLKYRCGYYGRSFCILGDETTYTIRKLPDGYKLSDKDYVWVDWFDGECIKGVGYKWDGFLANFKDREWFFI